MQPARKLLSLLFLILMGTELTQNKRGNKGETRGHGARQRVPYLGKEMAGLGGPGSGCPWALQALLASSPPGSLSPRSPPSSRGSLLSLFKGPLSLEETFGSASIGSLVSVVRALAWPRWRRQPSERGQPLPTRLPTPSPSGPWSAPRAQALQGPGRQTMLFSLEGASF
ncbi:hypothetical protein J1605_019622 [Eschrichtius robustus]|uniref:Uncharacterized protein n=1 Tax=Eschrichtius robustus TaxID=9764 RepID=A0AB34HMN3_ESCRO|nr:hypothetical protein J1605_019622 [Eschrichtius robustus]